MPCPLLQGQTFNCLFNDHLTPPPSNCQFAFHVALQMRGLQVLALNIQRVAT